MGDFDGSRIRYFLDRRIAEASSGRPLRKDVSDGARQRLVREIRSRAFASDVFDADPVPFWGEIVGEFRRVTGDNIDKGPQQAVLSMSVEEFLTFLEIGTDRLLAYRQEREDVDALQSILADDASAFRLCLNNESPAPRYVVREIDNEHLDREIVDKTFELARNVELASAQRDYAEAWKHYAKGDFDDAIVNAHKAFESAAKVVIMRLDRTCAVEGMQTNQLVPELKRLDLFPGKLANMVTPLLQIFQNAGALRNAAGTGHGSVDLASPEAHVALLGLHFSGSLVYYLAQRLESLESSEATNG